jgi:hypothetical protein
MARMVDVEAKIKWEKEKSWLIANEVTGEEGTWVPKYINGIPIECDEGKGGWAVFTMPEWLAAEKGLV